MATKPNRTFSSTRAAAILLLIALQAFIAPHAAALGLGALEVKSNLDQPLEGLIELRVAPGDDLSTVTANIASRDDFERLGIDYPSYLSDISLSLEDMGSGDYVLRVVSGDVVIKEPFIHFLVRVDWSGGSFLREYTALIDPPVYAAEAPQSVAQPRVVGTDEAFQPEPEPQIAAEPLDDASGEDSIVSEPVQEVFTDPDPVYDEPVGEDTASFDSSDASAADTLGSLPTDAQYGPVASGESLSVIAEELQRQFPDLSIFQIMQVLFEENRDSFINDNINGLLQGAVLNIGDLDAIRRVDIEQARQFFYQQVLEWDPSVLVADSADSSGFDGVSVGQDEYSFDDTISSSDSTDFGSSDFGSSTDAFQVGASTETDALVSRGNADASAAEVLALQQQISDLETSLASSELENRELTERISLLEGQLADMNRLLSMDVEDADLAAVEAALAAQNNADAAIDPLSDVSGDLTSTDSETGLVESESGSDFIDPTELVADDSGFIDPLATLEEADATDSVIGLDDEAAVLEEIEDSSLGETDASIAASETETQPTASSTRPTAQTSFLADLQTSVVDSGLWKILAGAGVLVFGGLGLWFVRRRRADEEFEISMMSIETQSYSKSEEKVVPTPEDDEEKKSEERDTSFLTVYSDTDAVVQADEVDPVAEADVYIAYGRDEQAEEVLLDGIASHPSRVDIKQKLLTLYHKNSNVEGFERIAEELYSQKNFLTKDVWQDVSLMGKDLAPENPLFDVSSAELLADDADGSGGMITSGDSVESEMTIEDDTTTAASELSVTEDSEMSTDQASEGDDAGDATSIDLINFDDQSDMSVLDEVQMDELDLNEDDADEVIEVASHQSEELDFSIDPDEDDDDKADDMEIDFEDDYQAAGPDQADSDIAGLQNSGDEIDVEVESDVSGLEISEDYDEARTQYELAKVFVDLGDEDGARKILGEIVANEDNDEAVLEDANKLLASIDA